MAELKAGEKATIVELLGGQAFQKRLHSVGVREGKTLRVVARHPFSGPMVVEVDGRQTTIGRGMSGKISVRQEK